MQRSTLLAASALTFAIAAPGCFGEARSLRTVDRAAQNNTHGRAGDLRVRGHWIEFRGKPTLLIGDSLSQGWMELGTNFDQDAYVDALASRGINVLLIWAYMGIEDQVADPRIGYDAPECWPWTRTGAGFDLGSFNAAYFDRLERLIARAGAGHIVVILTIHDGWTKTRFRGHPFNRANGGPLDTKSQYVELHDYAREMPANFDETWSRREKNQHYQERFVARLLQSTDMYPNVILEVCNEGEWYNQEQFRPYTKHFVDFIKARVTRNAVMVNDDHVGGASFGDDPNCDLISLHKPLWTTHTRAVEFFNHYAAAFASPAKPQIFGEPVPEYQGNPAQHEVMTRLMWATALGGAGVLVPNDASWGFDPNTHMATKAAHRDVILDREGHCARFFADSVRDLAGLLPQGALTSTGICLAAPGREYVVYSQASAPFRVDLSAAGGRMLDCRFFNPRTGGFGPVMQRAAGSTAEPFSAPDRDDWILHIIQGSAGSQQGDRFR